jgi:hypothetical protein
MDFVLSNTIKIDILNKARPLIENALYEILILQGFDPETFDPDTFVPVENNLDHETITKLVQKHLNLISKIEELGG